jgi:hypothetical protein
MIGNLSPKTLARLEAIAREIEPPFGPAETAILWSIGIADEILPDPEAEPWLGWCAEERLKVGHGPEMIFRGWTDRQAYQHRNCLDLEGPDADLEPSLGVPETPPLGSQIGWARNAGTSSELEDDGGDLEPDHPAAAEYSDDPDVPQYPSEGAAL